MSWGDGGANFIFVEVIAAPKREPYIIPRSGTWLVLPHREPSRAVSVWGALDRKGALMRYKARNIAALQMALGSLPDNVRVEVDPDIEVSAKTVGELRKVTALPENLAVTTPQERHADSAVKVSKVKTATGTTPKR
jgi:hypothetical protein